MVKFPKDMIKNILFRKNLLRNMREILKIKKNDISFLNSGWGAHFLTSIEIFKDYPFTGSGLKTFRKICSNKKYEEIKSLNFKNRCATHPHQTYFEILSETGAVSLIFFIFLIVILFKNIYLDIISKKKMNISLFYQL